MTSVLVAEDDPLALSGITTLLTPTDFELLGAVSDGSALLKILPDLQPDVLLMDVNMPNLGGIEVLAQLRGQGDQRPIVLITGFISGPRAIHAIKEGASGLIIKSRAPDDLIPCLRSAVAGKRWYDREILQGVIESMLAPQATHKPYESLTIRECQVADLVITGAQNQEIAMQLGLTVGTVKSHLHNIYTKMGVRDRAALTLKVSRVHSSLN